MWTNIKAPSSPVRGLNSSGRHQRGPPSYTQEWRPADHIVEAATEREADPIAMGTPANAASRSAMIGSVAEAVLRRASCPVLTAGRGASHRSIAVFPGALSRLHEVGARRPDGGGRSPGPVSGRHPVRSGNRIGRLSSPKADSDCPGRGFQPSAVDGDRDNGPMRQVSSIQAASSGRSALVTWGANDGWVITNTHTSPRMLGCVASRDP